MTDSSTAKRMTMISLTPPSSPRMRMEPTESRRTLLDGGWWPRSTDPVAELPGLILAIDRLHGPVTRLVLAADGWRTHPRRLGVDGRVLRLGFFASQSTSLLTAFSADGDRVDLLVVAPDTADGIAEAAMVLAATASNQIHAQHLLATVNPLIHGTSGSEAAAEAVWDDEGGQPGSGSIEREPAIESQRPAD